MRAARAPGLGAVDSGQPVGRVGGGSVGLPDRAVAAATVAETSAIPEVVRDAMFCRALVARASGDEDAARTLLTDVSVRWPSFARAR
ncbi:MAG: hypothetical protein JO191_07715, partial [Mycobacteriaceae bacterium]|nr:hypothetical protein [Mycobacteriaceae bacterium]